MNLKQIFRVIFKNKTYSVLNIMGLAVGIACAALIFLWAEDEFSYDKHFEKYGKVYQIMENQAYDGKIYTFESTPGPLSDALKNEIPGIKDAARVSWGQRQLLSVGDKNIYENIYYVDPSIFSIFPLPFIAGNAESVFPQLRSVVLSESVALKIFGEENPVGKALQVDHAEEYIVTAVIRDVPTNSSRRFGCLVPWQIFEDKNTWLRDWGNNALQTYVELEPNANVTAVNQQIEGFIQTKNAELIPRLFLFGMDQWRLYSKFENGKQVGGRIDSVRLFVIIAWIILIIACINFMNLATARSAMRAREVGVRKAIGAGKSKLIGQFLQESIITSFIAMLIAIGLVAVALPAFNALIGKTLALGLFKPLHLLTILLIGLLCGLFAGSYPAFYLSSFNPIAVLKGLKSTSGKGALFTRKGLVIFQFAVSVVLIICSLIVYMQIEHTKNRELGFNKEHLIRVSLQGDMKNHFHTIQQELINTGVVEDAAVSNQTMLNIGNNAANFFWKGQDLAKQDLISIVFSSSQLIETMGMQLVAGHDFSANEDNEKNNVIINQKFAELMGDEGRIGGILTRNDDQFEIIGIVKDFVYNNMYAPPAPMVMFCGLDYAGMMMIRLKPTNNLQQTLSQVENVVKSHSPGYPFDYRFYDEEFNQFFSTESFIGKLASLFAALAVFISCLGLFGLSAFSAEQRTKEVGIRKVMGASVSGLVSLLTVDFMKQVLLSVIVATPIAWWVMHRWLQGFSYRIYIPWWVFVAVGCLACLIALLTVGWQAVSAATADPVKSIKTE